jgi:hypothetical protein
LTLHNIAGEPRIRDVELGQKLGYSRPSKIRETIKRQIKHLEKIGSVKTIRSIPENGGRTVDGYLLNKNQALFVLMCADKTPSDVRISIAKSITAIDAVLQSLNDFEVPEGFPDMYVYAIREKGTGNIKLGISVDPERRLRDLQTGNSNELELVAYVKAKNRFADETALHKKASGHHIRGEWFSQDAATLIA